MSARDNLGPQWHTGVDRAAFEKERQEEDRMKGKYYGEFHERTSMVPANPKVTSASPNSMVPANPEVPSASPKGFDSSYAGETWDDGANDYEVF